jgi:hypothetical protein
MKVPKTVWLIALLMLVVALLWFPCAPKKISPATAYFGLCAVSGVVCAGYRFVRRIWARVKKISVK